MQSSSMFTKKRILVAAIVAILLATVGAMIIYLVTRPNQEDFQTAKQKQITATTEARKALAPAVNEYLAAFKAAYNESDSITKARDAAKAKHDAFKQKAAKATQSMQALAESRVANDAQIGTAIRQLQKDYDDEITYYSGLVDSYPEYTALFAQGSDGCSGIFVGKTDGLADRRTKLDAAAKRCYGALDTLKKSSNLTYVDYAKKVERRVKAMQADAATTAKAEATLKEFQARATDYQRQYDEAKARNASDEEILKLADELKKFNAEIADNRATFDFAAKNYLDTVKGMPALFGAVYDTEVPAKQKYYNQLIEFRTEVLASLLEGRLPA